MARPIEPTPVLESEDAERLLEQLEDVCSPEEAERRIAAARKLLAKVLVNGDARAEAEADEARSGMNEIPSGSRTGVLPKLRR